MPLALQQVVSIGTGTLNSITNVIVTDNLGNTYDVVIYSGPPTSIKIVNLNTSTIIATIPDTAITNTQVISDGTNVYYDILPLQSKYKSFSINNIPTIAPSFQTVNTASITPLSITCATYSSGNIYLGCGYRIDRWQLDTNKLYSFITSLGDYPNGSGKLVTDISVYNSYLYAIGYAGLANINLNEYNLLTGSSTPGNVYYTGLNINAYPGGIKRVNDYIYYTVNSKVYQYDILLKVHAQYTNATIDARRFDVYNGYLYVTAYNNNYLYKVILPIPPSIPLNSVSFDTGNTRTVASGNLKLSIFDPSNTLTNNVYYEYSLNGGVYINTNVNAGPSPNNLYVLSSDISNTILVRAKNSLGNSTPISLQTVIYQKPTIAPAVSLSLVSSGNVQVTVSETNPVPYYYLNNVSYVCYPYPNSGTNLSANIRAYSANIGILANTNTTYIPVASYVSGLSANTYTFYVKAQNQFGNTETTTISQNISVYTIPNPPVIDTGNTLSNTSGNLTVTFNDTTNTPLNNINYVYFVYDSTVDLYY